MNEIEQLKSEHTRELNAYETTVQNKDKQIEALVIENARMRTAINATIGWQQSVDAGNTDSVRMLLELERIDTVGSTRAIAFKLREIISQQLRSGKGAA